MDDNFANLLIAIYRQAYVDYEKGKKTLLRRFGKLISENEFHMKAEKRKPSNYEDFSKITAYFDAINFFIKDPYGLYGGMSRKRAIEILDRGFQGNLITEEPEFDLYLQRG